jgi:hypothetical protein
VTGSITDRATTPSPPPHRRRELHCTAFFTNRRCPCTVSIDVRDGDRLQLQRPSSTLHGWSVPSHYLSSVCSLSPRSSRICTRTLVHTQNVKLFPRSTALDPKYITMVSDALYRCRSRSGIGKEKKNLISNSKKHQNPNPNHEAGEVQGLPVAYLATTTAFVRDRSRHRAERRLRRCSWPVHGIEHRAALQPASAGMATGHHHAAP